MTQLVPVVNSKDHIQGDPDARIELVEYGDYECPYCGRAYPLIKHIQLEFGNEVAFIFRNFPLSKIHRHAVAAAVATEAAALQNKFWEMHDIIFENQDSLGDENILLLGVKIGLDPEKFASDIRRRELLDKVESDFESGLRSGVNRTPTFFINGKKYEGNWERDQLYYYLKEYLQVASISI